MARIIGHNSEVLSVYIPSITGVGNIFFIFILLKLIFIVAFKVSL
jgi:hypothetical protein